MAVVAKERMEQWQELLDRNGLRVQSILPEALALGQESDGWTLLVEPDQALLRIGPFTATALV